MHLTMQARVKGWQLRHRLTQARKAAKLQYQSRPTTPASLSARQLVLEHRPSAAATIKLHSNTPSRGKDEGPGLHDPLADLWDLDLSGESGEESSLSIQSSFVGFGTRGSTHGDEAICSDTSAASLRYVMSSRMCCESLLKC